MESIPKPAALQPTASQKARVFLQEVLAFNRALEETLVDVLAAFIPWLAPAIPAYLAWRNMTGVLGFDPLLAGVGAVVVEFLGLATVSTTVSLWDYNDTKRVGDQRAPLWVAGLTALGYIGIVLTVNVLLDDAPALHLLAQALLSLLSVIGAVTLAIRAQHARRLARIEAARQEERKAAEEARQERREERQARKAERQAAQAAPQAAGELPEAFRPGDAWAESAPAAPKSAPPAGKQPPARRQAADWRDLTVEEKLELAGLSPVEIGKLYPVSERTARTWRGRLQKNGFHPQGAE